MSALAELLRLPRASWVGDRVPKTMLTGVLDMRPSDRRVLDGGVRRIEWVASLNHRTMGLQPDEFHGRPVHEIAVLELETAPGVRSADARRLATLLHRAVPNLALVGHAPQGRLAEIGLALTREHLRSTVVDEEWWAPVGVGESLDWWRGDPVAFPTVTSFYENWLQRAAVFSVCHAVDRVPVALPSGSTAETLRWSRSLLADAAGLADATRRARAARRTSERVEANREAAQLRQEIVQKSGQVATGE
ncbi:DUF4391 domain-containing protein [Kytococcus sedentarius]|uniref:DUF4391 domain-containing protein n=1 Tax=Kytococcus sedentarius TaxID=1276 RepID=UPI003879D68A